MRHRNKNNSLSRTASHRRAMFANMATSLIQEKQIVTTLPKAKALRRYVEPIITKSKTDTVHSRRTVFASLQDKYAVQELFGEVSPRIMERPGGYTRILKLGPRGGDSAEMALVELVDFNEFDYSQNKGAAAAGKKKRRRRGKKSKGAGEQPQQEASATASAEEAAPAPEEETPQQAAAAASSEAAQASSTESNLPADEPQAESPADAGKAEDADAASAAESSASNQAKTGEEESGQDANSSADGDSSATDESKS